MFLKSIYQKSFISLLCFVSSVIYLVFLAPHQGIACPICEYWVFKDPYKNPIVPGTNFLGYWFPPQDNPEQKFTADGVVYQFNKDANHPKGPFFASPHDGIDIFAWLEKKDEICYIHLFKKTDIVKPTVGGMINPDGFKEGPNGVANIIHPPGKPLDTYEKYGHVDFKVNGGDQVTTNTQLGTLSDLGTSTFVHLHYSVYEGGIAKDPLNYMEKKQTTCIPEPSTLLLLGSGLAGLVGLGKKRLFKKA
jgi:hypothetical protein